MRGDNSRVGRQVKVGDIVRIESSSPMTGHDGCGHEVTERFVLRWRHAGADEPPRRYLTRARSASAATWPNAGHCGPATIRSKTARASSLRPL